MNLSIDSGVIANTTKEILAGLDKLFTSKEERIRAEAEKIKTKLQPVLQELSNAALQIELNSVQAKHPSIFVAGSRPAIVWVFAGALFGQFILFPVLEWVQLLTAGSAAVHAAAQHCNMESLIQHASTSGASLAEVKSICLSLHLGTIPLPSMAAEKLWPLIGGMLGLTGWRTTEKIKGVARENLKTN